MGVAIVIKELEISIIIVKYPNLSRAKILDKISYQIALIKSILMSYNQ